MRKQEKIESIMNNRINGNISDYRKDLKKLSKKDLFRLIDDFLAIGYTYNQAEKEIRPYL